VRAAVYRGPSDLAIEDVPIPVPRAGEVQIKVSYNGICGSDLHEYYDGSLMTPVRGPHPLTGVQVPVILGHEAAGLISAIGSGVDDLNEGDLVAIEPIYSCGTCAACTSGAYNHCKTGAFHGFAANGGGLAEYTVVPRRMVHRIPEGVTPMQAAIVEPMAVAYHAVQRSGVRAGDTCVVFGAGPIGLGACFALRSMGVTPIIVEPAESRRATASALGFAEVLDPATGEIADQVRAATGGHAAAACIDAAGVSASLKDALRSVTTHGTVVLVGVSLKPIELFTPLVFTTEANVTASKAYCNDFPAVIERMARGDYPTDHWVSTIPLERLIEDGFEVLRARKATKILVDLD
jgi:(R,R)-butanediol dehydrogenase/meso-butanediol dehydrogenase/diacetyl reductase